MPYRCQLIEKRIERDSVTDGADPDTSVITMTRGDHPPRTADTLHGAIAAAFGDFDLPTDYFFIPGEDETTHHISCNRNEDSECNPVNGSDSDELTRKLSEAGGLWLCDYEFAVEYYEKRPITRAELVAAFPSANVE